MAPKGVNALSVSALKARLRDNPMGAFVFYGQEELLKQFYMQKFVTLVEKEGMAEFNIVRLDFTRDHTIDDLLGEAEILPFGGEKRLIICRGFIPTKLNRDELEKLNSLLDSFPEYLILIIFTMWEEMGEDKKALLKNEVGALSQKADFVHFPLQGDNVLIPWSKKILARDRITVEDKTLRTLFRLCSKKMQLIRQELEKLSLYALSQGKSLITEEDVSLFAQDTTTLSISNLCDAVLDGAIGATESILDNLKHQDAEPIVITAALSRNLNSCLLVAEGADFASCQKAVKMQDWQFDKCRQAVYGKKKENFEKALVLCLELDKKLKGYRSDAWLVTEFAVLQMARLCGGKQ